MVFVVTAAEEGQTDTVRSQNGKYIFQSRSEAEAFKQELRGELYRARVDVREVRDPATVKPGMVFAGGGGIFRPTPDVGPTPTKIRQAREFAERKAAEEAKAVEPTVVPTKKEEFISSLLERQREAALREQARTGITPTGERLFTPAIDPSLQTRVRPTVDIAAAGEEARRAQVEFVRAPSPQETIQVAPQEVLKPFERAPPRGALSQTVSVVEPRAVGPTRKPTRVEKLAFQRQFGTPTGRRLAEAEVRLKTGVKRVPEILPEAIAFGGLAAAAPSAAVAVGVGATVIAAPQIISKVQRQGPISLLEEAPSALVFGAAGRVGVALRGGALTGVGVKTRQVVSAPSKAYQQFVLKQPQIKVAKDIKLGERILGVQAELRKPFAKQILREKGTIAQRIAGRLDEPPLKVTITEKGPISLGRVGKIVRVRERVIKPTEVVPALPPSIIKPARALPKRPARITLDTMEAKADISGPSARAQLLGLETRRQFVRVGARAFIRITRGKEVVLEAEIGPKAISGFDKPFEAPKRPKKPKEGEVEKMTGEGLVQIVKLKKPKVKPKEKVISQVLQQQKLQAKVKPKLEIKQRASLALRVFQIQKTRAKQKRRPALLVAQKTAFKPIQKAEQLPSLKPLQTVVPVTETPKKKRPKTITPVTPIQPIIQIPGQVVPPFPGQELVPPPELPPPRIRKKKRDKVMLPRAPKKTGRRDTRVFRGTPSVSVVLGGAGQKLTKQQKAGKAFINPFIAREL